MIHIQYCPEGESVSDFEYAIWFHRVARAYLAREDAVFRVSTSLPIDYTRLRIAQGFFANPEDVTFHFLDMTFHANCYGAIPEWPSGFCDSGNHIAEAIIITAMSKRKREE